MDADMKRTRLMSIIAFFTIIIGHSQSIFTGRVLDENGEPLPGASIVEKGTINGTQSDFDGNFTLEVTDKNVTLVISYLGFATKEVSLKGQSIVQIILVEDSAKLDEVVVTALGFAYKPT